MTTCLYAIPFVEFAYNSTPHTATKLSPFQIVYGFNPTTPLDLTPLPPAEFVNVDGESKAAYVKKLHQKVREALEKQNENRAKQANKGRKKLVFQPGEWVWLHFRPERFPNKRNSKLAPRGDGPFKVLERINDNAYRLELPGEYSVSPSFNVADLAPFDVDEPVLRSKPLQEGGNDEDIQAIDEPHGPVRVPFVPNLPMTRSRSKNTQHKFNLYVGRLLEQLEHMEQTQGIIHQDLARANLKPGPMHGQLPFGDPHDMALQANHMALLEDSYEASKHLSLTLGRLNIAKDADNQTGPELAYNASSHSNDPPIEADHSHILIKAKAAGISQETTEAAPIQALEEPWPLLAQNRQVSLNLLTTSFAG